MAVHAFGGLANVALVYLIPVLASASLYGMRTGVFTGIVSALAYNFFFLPPIYTFTIQDPENVLTVAVFIVVAIVTSQLAARVRVQANLAERSSGQNAALASFARMLAGLSSRHGGDTRRRPCISSRSHTICRCQPEGSFPRV